jgi:hypothetical protein
MNLEEVRARIAHDTGVPPQRQLMVVSEERARRANIGGLAKRLHLALNAQRDVRSLLMSLVKFIVLPEFVYRYITKLHVFIVIPSPSKRSSPKSA